LGLPESSSLLVVFAQFGTREDTDDQTNKQIKSNKKYYYLSLPTLAEYK
jgi:hypothetical protein